MEEYEDNIPVTWIEGIGSRNDYTFNSWYVEMVSSYSWMLTKCYDSHQIFYEVDASRETITDATKWEFRSLGVWEFGQYHCRYRKY